MEDTRGAGWLDFAADLLWVPKVIGAILTVCVWVPGLFIVALNPIGAVDPALSTRDWLLAALGLVAWWFFYFRLLCPYQRWVRDAGISRGMGQPIPPFGKDSTRLSGTPFDRFAGSVNRTIDQFGCRGISIHPSEDGNNDLGQVGPLARSSANRFGYNNKLSVDGPARPGCERCGHTLYGARRCRSCGSHVHPNGRIDLEAEANFARASYRSAS